MKKQLIKILSSRLKMLEKKNYILKNKLAKLQALIDSNKHIPGR
jgi:hypothetical protein